MRPHCHHGCNCNSVSRYVDIVLGVCLLLSQLLLCYSAVKKKRDTLTLFFILSMAVLVLYWVWFAYLKYGKGESEASKEVILARVWLLARQ